MAEQTLNVPQLIVFILVSVLALRWYFSKPTGDGTQSAASSGRASRATPAQIDQVAGMFPQVERRRIAWDLHRNGGNIALTTERILSGRPLDNPPASFDAPLARASNPRRPAPPPAKPAQPDLITRYNLSSKLDAPAEPATAVTPDRPKGWSQDRVERQANLARRREEMILAARRKLEARDKAI